MNEISTLEVYSYIENSNTRASSADQVVIDQKRRMPQSPGIIRSIINNFVKTKRVVMYNFNLQEFLNDSKHEEKNGLVKNRPMSNSLRRQLEEVESLKNKLANKKIRCRVHSLYNGIVTDDSFSMNETKFPTGGELLQKKSKKS